MEIRTHSATRLAAVFFLILLSGCATAAGSPPSQSSRFFDLLNRYPPASGPLRLQPLTVSTATGTAAPAGTPDVYVMVHPAYSLFFQDANKPAHYTDVKYELLRRQFDDEARFLSETARSGSLLILIVPGRYAEESPAPGSYTDYLNTTVPAGANVFYLFSDSTNNGTIAMNDMVDLYRFLQIMRAGRVLVGGGYIGRCQREFYNELTSYLDKSLVYIVPEISTISPEDISDDEAAAILGGIERHDYAPVRQFIDRKLDGSANVLSLPWKRKM